MTDVQHSKPYRLAYAAYQAALAEKTESAGRYIQRISDECGGSGLNFALRAWSDWYADHATDGQPVRSKARVAYIRSDTGQLDREDSDRLPPHIRWAGQIIAARCALDQDRFEELIDEMPRDGQTIGEYVSAVLLTVARTVNGLPRGFARIGGR